jgi:hypothetical protein
MMDERNFIDYFAVCGLDVKMGLELESSETCGNIIIFSEIKEFIPKQLKAQNDLHYSFMDVFFFAVNRYSRLVK